MYWGTEIDAAACLGIEIETLEIRTLFFHTLGPSQTLWLFKQKPRAETKHQSPKKQRKAQIISEKKKNEKRNFLPWYGI